MLFCLPGKQLSLLKIYKSICWSSSSSSSSSLSYKNDYLNACFLNLELETDEQKFSSWMAERLDFNRSSWPINSALLSSPTLLLMFWLFELFYVLGLIDWSISILFCILSLMEFCPCADKNDILFCFIISELLMLDYCSRPPSTMIMLF